MESLFKTLEGVFTMKVFGDFQLYELISTVFKYIFVFIVFYFIYNIIKMIYLDISSTETVGKESDTYLKLINRKEQLPFKVMEHYYLSNSVLIGREDSNDIVIKDRFISKTHAQIIRDEGIYFLEDLGSANGTFLNGQQIFDAIELKDKDIIDIGQVEFLFVDGGDYE
ncbi:MAG: FHA domain-containing protein [Tissierellia bacterium]|nr:FHA domain-containing protein [Tissierellia bacterium]